MHSPRALLLDLDDTLLDDRGAMADAVLVFRAKHGLSKSESDDLIAARWDSIGREVWRKMALGELSFVEQRRVRLRETFLLTLSDVDADELFESYLECYQQSWRLLPGVDVFLERTAHLPRAIVTNGHGPQARKKLSLLGLGEVFDAVVTPDDCGGARKPDLKIFRHALDLLDVAPDEVMMIGDNEEADIAPALALGMRCFHVRHQQSGFSIADAANAICSLEPRSAMKVEPFGQEVQEPQ